MIAAIHPRLAEMSTGGMINANGDDNLGGERGECDAPDEERDDRVDETSAAMELSLEEVALVLALLDELQAPRIPPSEIVELAAEVTAMLRARAAAR